MGSGITKLGVVVKGYPRISESFIANEILALEEMGLRIEIYSLRAPREGFTHRKVREIQASVTYLPDYVLPRLGDVLAANGRTFLTHPIRYLGTVLKAVGRTVKLRSPLGPTLRHLLQAGYLVHHRLSDATVSHLHAHFCHTPTSVALFASEMAQIPFSFTAHAKDIYTSHPSKLRHKIAKARFVVTCTEYNRRYLQTLARGLATPFYTIYHGIDLSTFRYGYHPCEAPPWKILSVGRLVRKKGYDDLLVALKMLHDSGVRYHFLHVGDGELRGEITAMAQCMGLGESVRFLGTLTHEELIPLYRTSHLFALACKIAPNGDRDGLPNVILEAMAIGIPVVSTDVSAIPEAIEHERTGLLVPPGDPQALACAMRRALDNREEAMQRAALARDVVAERFDMRRWTPRLGELLRRALTMSPTTG